MTTAPDDDRRVSPDGDRSLAPDDDRPVSPDGDRSRAPDHGRPSSRDAGRSSDPAVPAQPVPPRAGAEPVAPRAGVVRTILGRAPRPVGEDESDDAAATPAATPSTA